MAQALERQPTEDHPRYSLEELIEIRRQVLRYARSILPGPDRNQHRQVSAAKFATTWFQKRFALTAAIADTI
jgi:hypothetical protein